MAQQLNGSTARRFDGLMVDGLMARWLDSSTVRLLDGLTV
jgi:hypothetical protein